MTYILVAIVWYVGGFIIGSSVRRYIWPDGVLRIQYIEDKEKWVFEVIKPLDDISKKKRIVLKVVKDSQK